MLSRVPKKPIVVSNNIRQCLKILCLHRKKNVFYLDTVIDIDLKAKQQILKPKSNEKAWKY